MFGRNFRRWRAGTQLHPRTVNAPIEAAERAERIWVGAPMNMVSGANGGTISLAKPLVFYAKITAVLGTGLGAAYAWTEQYATGPGTWTDGYLSGTTSVNPAYNTVVLGTNQTLTLPITVVMRATVANDFRFSAGACTP